MMGPSHAASGALAGTITLAHTTTQETTLATPGDILLAISITAGAALLPDLDTPNATLARTFGPLSQGLSQATNRISAAIANTIHTRRDHYHTNGHRLLTHTILFNLFAAMFAYVLMDHTPGLHYVVLFILSTLAFRGLFSRTLKHLPSIIPVVLGGVVTLTCVVAHITATPMLVATYIGVGTMTHLLGDAVTKAGIPAFAPLPVWGKIWYDWHILPTRMRFYANGPVNNALFYVFIAGTIYTIYYMITRGLVA